MSAHAIRRMSPTATGGGVHRDSNVCSSAGSQDGGGVHPLVRWNTDFSMEYSRSLTPSSPGKSRFHRAICPIPCSVCLSVLLTEQTLQPNTCGIRDVNVITDSPCVIAGSFACVRARVSAFQHVLYSTWQYMRCHPGQGRLLIPERQIDAKFTWFACGEWWRTEQ